MGNKLICNMQMDLFPFLAKGYSYFRMNVDGISGEEKEDEVEGIN